MPNQMLLKYSYQYDVKKIADILNITEGNVRQRLLRGRQMLEKALNKLEDK
jgi:DNA-directed RNA polymerase specialized sigma24 family protein